MKIKAVFILLLFTSLLVCCKKSNSPTNSNVHLDQGLLAYYPFNGNANDQSVNKMNGVVQNGVSFSADVSGKANSAVTFDGTSGYIFVPDSAGVLSPAVISVSLLFNLKDITKRAAFINKVNFADATGLSYSIGIPYDNTNQFEFGAVPYGYDCSSGSYNVNDIATYNNTPIATDTWYHVVAVFSDSVQKLYVNGILNTSANRNFGKLNQCPSNKTFLIGGWWNNDIISMNGSLDELRIYNRPLNQDEITELAKPVTNK